ncbi:hypothetical protein VNI00_018367 [Paramarasmius palmivorus]|uniref:Uncharacterized protein n=1 Tax=Paramarasmius palmivorus TaxID=297713 RepID=A0AAW0AXM7_9AGAR
MHVEHLPFIVTKNPNSYPPQYVDPGNDAHSAFDLFKDLLDEPVILDELKPYTADFLLNHSPWLNGLDRLSIINASLSLFEEWVDSIVLYVVQKIRKWDVHKFSIYNITCGVFPTRKDMFLAAAIRYCGENSIVFLGERPVHPLLIKYLSGPFHAGELLLDRRLALAASSQDYNLL